MKYYSVKKQSGTAAIIFVLMFPALFAVFVWGVEGARIVQSSARLMDATEIAALAVASQDIDDESECQAVAKSVIQTYFPSSLEIKVPAKSGEDAVPCMSSTPNKFDITASVEENTWFPTAPIANFGDTYIVSNSISVQRDRLAAMDVVIAADYSFSMADYETRMKDTITTVANFISDLNEVNLQQSRLALLGFDQFVKYTDDEGTTYYTPHLVCTSVVGNSNNEYNCNKENNSLIENNAKDGVYDHWNIGSYDKETKGKISIEYTLDHIFDPLDYKDDNSGDKETTGNGNGGETGNTIDFDSTAEYETVNFSEDPADILDSLEDFSMPDESNPDFGSYSASYTGLIQAAILMNDFGENRVRKIIMLTNGDKEDPFAEVAESLINAGGDGLCKTVLESIRALKGPGNTDVIFELFVVSYDSSSTVTTQIGLCAEESLDAYADDYEEGVVGVMADDSDDEIELMLNSQKKLMGRLLEE